MKTIRNRKRVDQLKTELRAKKQSFSKWIYLGAVSFLIIWLLDLFFGDYIYFRADGIVMQKQNIVSTHYTTSVEELYVKVGQKITKGQLISRGVSMDVLRDMAVLRTRLSEVIIRKSELIYKVKALGATLPIAKIRANEMAKLVKKNKAALSKGLTTSQRYARFLEDEYKSQSDYIKMKVALEGSSKELEVLEKTIDQANKILNALNKEYNEGYIRTQSEGLVSRIYVSSGSIVKAGDPLIEILSGDHVVMAYAAPGAFHTPKLGDEVIVTYGVHNVRGEIKEILALTHKLPEEIQKAFRPKDRSQILMILLDPEEGQELPPTFTKVTVRSSGYLMNKISTIFNSPSPTT